MPQLWDVTLALAFSTHGSLPASLFQERTSKLETLLQAVALLGFACEVSGP